MPRDAFSPSDLDLLADQRWRVENLYCVLDERGKIRPFKPNPVQSRILGEIHGRDLILKSRQHGVTTLATLILLDDCIWYPNTASLVIAHKQDDARKIFRNKIKWVWEKFCDPDTGFPNLVDQLGLKVISDSADELRFSNGSSLTVSLSGRSGTYQNVLITEFGKICAQFPARADEVVSGALNTAHKSARVFIESTAEGSTGHFYRMARRAMEVTPGADRWPASEDDFASFGDQQSDDRRKKKLSRLDFKFHFYGWWEDPRNVLNPNFVDIDDAQSEYFDKVETQLGIKISPQQRAWYAQKEKVEQGGMMPREHPSHPAEAFAAALSGCYFEAQILAAKRHGRIGNWPIMPGVPVNTFWDLGRRDYTSIWLHQQDGENHRFVGFYENCGEFISHYVNWLDEWRRDNQAVWGKHYAPHDVKREDEFMEHGRLRVAKNAGIDFEAVSAASNKLEAIAAAQGIFTRCYFDQRSCHLGLDHLRQYRKDWNKTLEVWRDDPRHDEHSHAADAFDTFVRGYRMKPVVKKKPKKRQYTGGLI